MADEKAVDIVTVPPKNPEVDQTTFTVSLGENAMTVPYNVAYKLLKSPVFWEVSTGDAATAASAKAAFLKQKLEAAFKAGDQDQLNLILGLL